MEEELYFNFQVDTESLKILVAAVDQYIQQWPGGSAEKQEELKKIQSELHKAYLELTFLE